VARTPAILAVEKGRVTPSARTLARRAALCHPPLIHLSIGVSPRRSVRSGKHLTESQLPVIAVLADYEFGVPRTGTGIHCLLPKSRLVIYGGDAN
jgi:hypothetical protein